MHGNVWEWCGDYGRDYSRDRVKDPEGVDRASVCCAAAVGVRPELRAPALRNRVEPTFRYVDSGFRLALTAEQ
jgi:formylglycine-generating enzyme required for sulfatase activity